MTKALTVRQPHAQLIALGVKSIETRSWAMKYRGRLVIHAAAKISREMDGLAGMIVVPGGGHWSVERKEELLVPPWDGKVQIPYELPLGAVVASCNLVDVVPIRESAEDGVATVSHMFIPAPKESPHAVNGRVEQLWLDDGRSCLPINDQLPYGDFTPGRYAWLLEDIKPVEERCPACWGDVWKEDADHDIWRWCKVCRAQGKCRPIPTKGRQGLWEWTA